MMKQTGGNGGEYAEIIVDYKNKKVDILNPTTRKELKRKWYVPQVKYFLLGMLLWVAIDQLLKNVNISFLSNFISNHFYYSYGFAVIVTWGILIIPKINEWFEYLTQRLENDFSDKKIVIIEDLKAREYKLPFVFKNNILEYECYGDYKKLEKVHIKPLDYYYKREKGLIKQTKEWEAFFTFEEIPKQGKMIVSFT